MPAPTWKDKTLFTPGPLTTSHTVKQAMLRDLGSRDHEFIALLADVRRHLVEVAAADPELYTAVLMQGSGTFAIESVIGSVIPPSGRLVVLVNGAYGERIVHIAQRLGIDVSELRTPENRPVAVDALDTLLASDQGVTHVAVVHCETTTGLMNPVEAVGAITARYGRRLIVDAMSSFGAVPLAMAGWNIDFLISSANKCIEGVPGFAFVLARIVALQATAGYARSISLDLRAQYEGLEKAGQFRFTPPVQVIMAFHQALLELEAEGGVAGRSVRYRRNYERTLQGMTDLGFRPYLAEHDRGYIITSFHYPSHPGFDFQHFYQLLSDRGHVIYAGKLSHADCFRVGHIGRLRISDVENLLSSVRAVLSEMGLST